MQLLWKVEREVVVWKRGGGKEIEGAQIRQEKWVLDERRKTGERCDGGDRVVCRC